MVRLKQSILIYCSSYFLEWLLFLQKITFVIVLIWVLGVNEEIRKKIKSDGLMVEMV